MKPRIGLAMDLEDGTGPRACNEKGAFFLLKTDYVERIVEAGGTPLLLAASDDASVLDGYLDVIDGLLMTGSGIDIPAEMYGHERHPEVKRVYPSKSAFEVALVKRASERALPYLAICNGMQAMNVAHGGTLWQDLPSEKGVQHSDPTPTKPCHGVRIEAGTRLHALVGTVRADVNSSHHQAVRDVGGGLVVAALSEADGIVEAIEDPSRPFAIGVQWHPELIPEHAGSRALFEGLVRAASGPLAKRAARDG